MSETPSLHPSEVPPPLPEAFNSGSVMNAVPPPSSAGDNGTYSFLGSRPGSPNDKSLENPASPRVKDSGKKQTLKKITSQVTSMLADGNLAVITGTCPKCNEDNEVRVAVLSIEDMKVQCYNCNTYFWLKRPENVDDIVSAAKSMMNDEHQGVVFIDDLIVGGVRLEDDAKVDVKMKTIFVEMPDGIAIAMEIDFERTFMQLKYRIEEEHGIPFQDQMFSFNGKTITDDNSNLKDCYVYNEATLRMIGPELKRQGSSRKRHSKRKKDNKDGSKQSARSSKKRESKKSSQDAQMKQEWACENCTYLNLPGSVLCEMCASPRGIKSVHVEMLGDYKD